MKICRGPTMHSCTVPFDTGLPEKLRDAFELVCIFEGIDRRVLDDDILEVLFPPAGRFRSHSFREWYPSSDYISMFLSPAWLFVACRQHRVMCVSARMTPSPHDTYTLISGYRVVVRKITLQPADERRLLADLVALDLLYAQTLLAVQTGLVCGSVEEMDQLDQWSDPGFTAKRQYIELAQRLPGYAAIPVGHCLSPPLTCCLCCLVRRYNINMNII